MTDKPITAKELEELFGKVDFQQLVKDEILKEGAEEIQRKYNHYLLTTLYGSSFTNGFSYEENGNKYMVIPSENYEYLMKKPPKKIKRRMSYDVYYWTKTDRVSKYFESAKKAKNAVRLLRKHRQPIYHYVED